MCKRCFSRSFRYMVLFSTPNECASSHALSARCNISSIFVICDSYILHKVYIVSASQNKYMDWNHTFEVALQNYRLPLFLLTTATFLILLARVFTISDAALSVAVGFFILGSLNLLAAGITAAYSIVRFE